MKPHARKPVEFTGRHMLGLMLAFFGTVIAVNISLAVFARTSWTGLVVENAYVASQEFNERAAEGRAQAALGWKSSLVIAGGEIRYRLTDASGAPIAVRGMTVKLRRPAYEAEDQVFALNPSAGGAFAIRREVRDGIWIVETDASVEGAPPYREVHRVVVADGAAR